MNLPARITRSRRGRAWSLEAEGLGRFAPGVMRASARNAGRARGSAVLPVVRYGDARPVAVIGPRHGGRRPRLRVEQTRGPTRRER